eukprot:4942484-Amphidinium_carterae.1
MEELRELVRLQPLPCIIAGDWNNEPRQATHSSPPSAERKGMRRPGASAKTQEGLPAQTARPCKPHSRKAGLGKRLRKSPT